MDDKDIFQAIKHRNPVTVSYNIRRGDFLICKSPTTSWICIASHTESGKVYYFANYNYRAKLLRTNDWFLSDYVVRHATEDEKEALLQVLDGKNILWIESLNTLVGMDDVFSVPEAITLFKPKGCIRSDKHIGISNANQTKILFGAVRTYGIVYNDCHSFERVDCILVPCRYQDIQIGEVAFRVKELSIMDAPAKNKLTDLKNYVKKQGEGYVYLDGESIIKSYDYDFIWYKVTMG